MLKQLLPRLEAVLFALRCLEITATKNEVSPASYRALENAVTALLSDILKGLPLHVAVEAVNAVSMAGAALKFSELNQPQAAPEPDTVRCVCCDAEVPSGKATTHNEELVCIPCAITAVFYESLEEHTLEQMHSQLEDYPEAMRLEVAETILSAAQRLRHSALPVVRQKKEPARVALMAALAESSLPEAQAVVFTDRFTGRLEVQL
jgi:hypothetical protein